MTRFAWLPKGSSERPPADPVLLATVVALVAFGVVMVFSASAVAASQRTYTGHDGHYFLVRQAAFACVAVPFMLLVARIDAQHLKRLAYPTLGTAALLMMATLVIGRTVGGARRWIAIGPVNLQAAELAKVALVVYLAHSLSKKTPEQIRSFKIGVLPHLAVLGIFAFLSYLQNDLGSAIMMGVITLAMLFAAGVRMGPILASLAGTVLFAVLVIAFSPWRRGRIEAFLDPFAHRRDSGLQIVESILAFGSGGWTGVGLGDSRQKLLFLPEAHTDFIGAIIGEELGFVGIVGLLAAFSVVVVRGFRAAFRAADDHAAYLAIGMTTFIGASAFANLAVATGLFPTKGLVLPFISYGGSSLLVCAGAMGVVLAVSRAPHGAPSSPAAAERGGSEADARHTRDRSEAGPKALGEGSKGRRASRNLGLRGATP